MKILYDHQMFTMQKFGGVTRYFAELITCLPPDIEACMPQSIWSDNYYLRETVNKPVKQLGFPNNFRVKRRIYYFMNNFAAHKLARKKHYDIIHPTWYDSYILKKRKKPLVITIHDLIQERFSKDFLFYDRSIKKKHLLMTKADHIIAVSHQTKEDIINMTGISPQKISVVHHGYRSTITPAAPLADNYILYVGDRRKYKNFSTLCEAVAPILHDNNTLSLICAGNSFTDEEFNLFKKLNISTTQIRAIHATDAELMSLYHYAKAFIYPSLYEGFGIPILEAFANNCPVCLSHTSCFPEVAGDAAIYFDPQSAESMRDTIENVLYMSGEGNRLRKAGLERVKQFTIEKMVNETCNIYRALM